MGDSHGEYEDCYSCGGTGEVSIEEEIILRGYGYLLPLKGKDEK